MAPPPFRVPDSLLLPSPRRDAEVLLLISTAANARTWYRIDEELGHGMFGTVWKARYYERNTSREKTVAIKFNKRVKQATFKRIQREAFILHSLCGHPNIIEYKHACWDGDLKLILVLEFMAGGNLEEFMADRASTSMNKALPPLSEETAWRFGVQIASAMKHVWKMGIIHRDLKPSNILLSEKTELARITVSDFGLARKYPKKNQSNGLGTELYNGGTRLHEEERDEQNAMAMSTVGTPLYMAPEIYSGSAYSNKVDIYSLGALIFVMLTGRPPFLGSTQYGVQMKKIQNAISLPPGSKVDKCAVDMMSKMLHPEPKHRWSPIEFFDPNINPFFFSKYHDKFGDGYGDGSDRDGVPRVDRVVMTEFTAKGSKDKCGEETYGYTSISLVDLAQLRHILNCVITNFHMTNKLADRLQKAATKVSIKNDGAVPRLKIMAGLRRATRMYLRIMTLLRPSLEQKLKSTSTLERNDYHTSTRHITIHEETSTAQKNVGNERHQILEKMIFLHLEVVDRAKRATKTADHLEKQEAQQMYQEQFAQIGVVVNSSANQVRVPSDINTVTDDEKLPAAISAARDVQKYAFKAARAGMRLEQSSMDNCVGRRAINCYRSAALLCHSLLLHPVDGDKDPVRLHPESRRTFKAVAVYCESRIDHLEVAERESIAAAPIKKTDIGACVDTVGAEDLLESPNPDLQKGFNTSKPISSKTEDDDFPPPSYEDATTGAQAAKHGILKADGEDVTCPSHVPPAMHPDAALVSAELLSMGFSDDTVQEALSIAIKNKTGLQDIRSSSFKIAVIDILLANENKHNYIDNRMDCGLLCTE